MQGFSFAGMHSSQFGCCYIPSPLDQGREMPGFVVEDIEVDGRDGEYYVGNRVKPRDFA